MLLYLKEEGVKYKPDIVILGFVPSDLARNMSKFHNRPKPKFVLLDNKLQLTNVPVPTISSIIRQEAFKSRIIEWISIIRSARAEAKNYVRDRKRLTEAILDEMIKTIKECGAQPLFVYISSPLAMSKNKPEEEILFEKFLKISAKNGVSAIYLPGLILLCLCKKALP